MSASLIPSVCIDSVFENVPVVEAIASVASSGIGAIEFWSWWDKDLNALTTATEKHGLEISGCCTKFVSLVDPACRDDYLAGLQESIQTARDIGTTTLISQVGDFRHEVPRDEQYQSLVDGLREAAPALETSGITLVIEPLNELVDHAGYFLVRSDEAFRIIEEVASPNVKVVFDIYHQQISEGNVISNLTAHTDKIGHFHAAGNPGRHELTRGEINYPEVFQAIRTTGYNGYVGLEYWPVDDPVAGLKEIAAWF
ncbi:MAG: TIM barrel protein [Verrucomicrobiales bacterium]|nr:TIM barrel protein [Verrucomicrobiales bacterium]